MLGTQFVSLDWDGDFSFPGMVKISTIGDGSCLFHAVINSFFSPYRTGILNGTPLNRVEFVKKFREELADKLGETSPTGVRYYDMLSRGQLHKFAETMPSFKLENMQTELRMGGAVDNRFNEFLSMVLNKDIYLLDAEKKDVYVTGLDDDILYLDRDSIVVMINGGHYELVGIKNDNITTLFSWKDPFIVQIRQRLSEKRKI